MINLFIKTGNNTFYLENVDTIYEDKGCLEFHGVKEEDFLIIPYGVLEYYFSCNTMDDYISIPVEFRENSIHIKFRGGD